MSPGAAELGSVDILIAMVFAPIIWSLRLVTWFIGLLFGIVGATWSLSKTASDELWPPRKHGGLHLAVARIGVVIAPIALVTNGFGGAVDLDPLWAGTILIYSIIILTMHRVRSLT